MKIFVRIFGLIGMLFAAFFLVLTINTDMSLHLVNYTYSNSLLDSNLNGLKIVQLSDFHNHSLTYKNGYLPEMVKSQNPDVIFLTGDFIDQYTDKSNIDDINELLTYLKDIPTYYITGNHEYYAAHQEEFYDCLKSHSNVTFLQNETTYFTYNGAKVNLVGLNDPRIVFNDNNTKDEVMEDYYRPIVKSLMENVDDSFTICLSHRPGLFDMLSEFNIDVTFSGHTHGGQLAFFDFFKYQSGRYEKNDSTLLVSNGLGFNGKMPVRYNAPMQLVSFTVNI